MSKLQCWCVCGRLNVITDGVEHFVCECGRPGEIDWSAEIEGRQVTKERREAA